MARDMYLAARSARNGEKMNVTDQQLVKKIISRITELEPDRFFLEASLPAEYMKGEWMRQQFQILDRKTEDRYQMSILVQIAKIQREDQMIANLTLHELMALVEQQNGG